MIQLKPTNLFAIPIHNSDKKFKYSRGGKLEFFRDMVASYGFSPTKHIKDIGFSFRILGTATKEVIDFDVEPFVERIIDNSIPNDLIYRDYTDDGKMKIDPITRSKSVLLGFYECGQKEESIKLSFYSLLKINKIYFENPYTHPDTPQPMCRDCADENGTCPSRNNAPCDPDEELENWQIAQSKVNDKYLIIQKLTN